MEFWYIQVHFISNVPSPAGYAKCKRFAILLVKSWTLRGALMLLMLVVAVLLLVIVLLVAVVVVVVVAAVQQHWLNCDLLAFLVLGWISLKHRGQMWF